MFVVRCEYFFRLQRRRVLRLRRRRQRLLLRLQRRRRRGPRPAVSLLDLVAVVHDDADHRHLHDRHHLLSHLFLIRE